MSRERGINGGALWGETVYAAKALDGFWNGVTLPANPKGWTCRVTKRRKNHLIRGLAPQVHRGDLLALMAQLAG